MKEIREMDDVDLIIALECNEVVVSTMEDWGRIKKLAKRFSASQGFYGRLLKQMEDFEEQYDIEMELPVIL